ncbi:MAG: transposase [Planctomycetota bacterium]
MRRERPTQARFLTFSCKDRSQLLAEGARRDIVADQIAASRLHLAFALHAWVVMPEHVHLLVTPRPPEVGVPRILSAIKRRSATRILAQIREHHTTPVRQLWQPGGGYDRNILGGPEFNEKIRYIHENPVRRGLVERPEDWAWSSASAWSGNATWWAVFDRSGLPEHPAG